MRLANWSIDRSPRQATAVIAVVCATAACAAFLWAAWGRPTSTAYTELRSFTGTDGYKPASGFVFDSTGALYGATQLGGRAGRGTVFSLKPPAKPDDTWNEVVLHDFGSEGDGQYPVGDLVFDKFGALYGATSSGGFGQGALFKLTPPVTEGGAWTETILYRFRGGSDGANPWSGLVIDGSGELYGTTLWGGGSGHGSVFKLTPPKIAGGEWVKSNLYSFRGGADGAGPKARLTLDANGVLYGTTELGGASDRGTVFKLTPPSKADNAWIKSTLYSFLGGADGAQPFSGVVSGPDGSLYGSTYYGGAQNCSGGCGTVFQLKPSTETIGAWTESVLHKFQGDANDGGNPSGVIIGPDGSLFGVAERKGAYRCGVVFQVTPPAKRGGAWKEVILYNFPAPAALDSGPPERAQNLSDMAPPYSSYGGLLLGRDGALFGALPKAGNHRMGVVYELKTVQN